MNIIYVIDILHNNNGVFHIDNVRLGYSTFEKAKEKLNELITREYNNLMFEKDDENYYIIDYVDESIGKYEKEIYIETKDCENMLIRYTIVEVEVLE